MIPVADAAHLALHEDGSYWTPDEQFTVRPAPEGRPADESWQLWGSAGEGAFMHRLGTYATQREAAEILGVLRAVVHPWRDAGRPGTISVNTRPA